MNKNLWKTLKSVIKNDYLKKVNSPEELKEEIKRQVSKAKLNNTSSVMTICSNQGDFIIKIFKDSDGKISYSSATTK